MPVPLGHSEKDEQAGGYVYFIRPIGLAGPVKIGCSKDPPHRLRAYQYWSPLPLEIVALVQDAGELEPRFHALFREHHSHHEWFHAAPEITATIEAIAAGTFDFVSLPPARALPGRDGWSLARRQRHERRAQILRQLEAV